MKTTTVLLHRQHDHDDQRVWNEFDARYRPILIGVAVRLGLCPEEASETAQEMLVQFLQDYRGHKYNTDHDPTLGFGETRPRSGAPQSA